MLRKLCALSAALLGLLAANLHVVCAVGYGGAAPEGAYSPAAVRRGRSGLCAGNRPAAAILLTGPTGVGKTALCKALAREVYGMGGEIVSAIRYHTTGRARMSLLEKIMYLADYIEPSRDFPGVWELRRACYEDIDAGLVMGLEMTVREMDARGEPLHRATLEALKDVKGTR